MERLTWDDYNGGCYAQDIRPHDYDTATIFTGEPIERLAAYERTNHTPEECVAAFKELSAYRAAERDGTLLRLPCAVGKTCYIIEPIVCSQCEHGDSKSDAVLRCNHKGKCPSRVVPRVVEGYEIDRVGISNPGHYGCDGFVTYGVDDSDIHYSEDSAEAALKEQEGQK